MVLTEAQRELVETNIYLVQEVLDYRIHLNWLKSTSNYNDIYQAGCIGLCKAAATDDKDTASFRTYASKVIYHEMINAIKKARRQSERETITDPDELPEDTGTVWGGHYDEGLDIVSELEAVMEIAPIPITKGIRALMMQAEGMSSKEIGRQLDASDKKVRVWMSRARAYLLISLDAASCKLL